MPDPLTVIGATSSILQLVQAISKGLLTLRNAVKATRDVYNEIQAIQNRIEQLSDPIKAVQTYVESHPTDCESELHVVISNLVTNCHASLTSCLESMEVMQSNLPKVGRSHQRIGAAIRMWIRERDMVQAKKHAEGYLQNLALILPLLNLFKVDQVHTKLNTISRVLENAGQYLAIDRRATASEDDRPALEIDVQIRTFAKHMATDIAMNEPDFLRRKAKRSRSIAASSITFNNDDQSQIPAVKPGKNQLVHELAANRNALDHLMDFQLNDSAVSIQRRAIEIKTLLATDPISWEHSNECYDMHEVLADILLQCDSKEARDEALSILQRQVHLFTTDPHDVANSTSSQDVQRLVNLHLKLGKAYKEIGQLDSAKHHLRTAFDAQNNNESRDLAISHEIGNHLMEVYEDLVQDSDGPQRAVRLSQLQGFRNEMETALGRPLAGNMSDCTEALRWCENAQIEVHEEDQRYKFDVLDPDVGASSPLHIAAEKCHDKTVLQQMIENSESLEILNRDNDTPLLVAAEKANIEAITLLIQNHASLKVRDHEQQTVLHKSKRTEVIRQLLQTRLPRSNSVSGASGSSGGHSHRPSVSSSATTATGTTYSGLASETDLDIDAQDIYQRTALWNACFAGRAKTVGHLLAAGADPNKCRHGTSPLAAALESSARPYLEDSNKRFQIVRALIHAGADSTPGKDLLSRRPRGIDHKRLLRALEAPPDRSLLSPFCTGSLSLPEFDFSELKI